MRRHIPLNAVRAFEAAARHLSVARAADELCVTPTAVTHQVRALEQFLQVALFERRKGRIALTPAGASAVRGLSNGFDLIEQALAPLARQSGRQEVVVGVGPSVASLWLMPKLPRFVAAHPDVAIKINSLVDVADFANSALDLAICNWDHHPNRRLDFLMEEQVVPVCAPALLSAPVLAGLTRPPLRMQGRSALAQLPLIHVDEFIKTYPTWPRYFHERQVAVANPSSGISFTQSSLAIEAAIKGYGALLGRSRLVAGALAERRLVAVDEAYPMRFKYFVVRPLGTASRAIRCFVDWLMQEARHEEPLLSAATG